MINKLIITIGACLVGYVGFILASKMEVPDFIDFKFESKPQSIEPVETSGEVDFVFQPVSGSYQVNKISKITSVKLNSFFKGKLANKGAVFIAAGKKYGIDPLFLAGIAIQESGNGSSDVAKRKNNVCGIYDGKKKTSKTFDSVDDCIWFTAKLLSNYVKTNKVTIDTIHKTYCPPKGATNDPKHLNGGWAKGVQSHMRMIGGENVLCSI